LVDGRQWKIARRSSALFPSAPRLRPIGVLANTELMRVLISGQGVEAERLEQIARAADFAVVRLGVGES
ncbi:hypothetical protein ACC695_40585, partial [Rhizobium ruizarguesonis]